MLGKGRACEISIKASKNDSKATLVRISSLPRTNILGNPGSNILAIRKKYFTQPRFESRGCQEEKVYASLVRISSLLGRNISDDSGSNLIPARKKYFRQISSLPGRNISGDSGSNLVPASKKYFRQISSLPGRNISGSSGTNLQKYFRLPRFESRRCQENIFIVCMGAENNNRLAVSKPSSKITKKTPAMARPAPKLYNIHPSGFRDLVQELTGNSFEPETFHTSPPLPPPGPNLNGRLQKFAPPPLSSDTTSAFPCLSSPLKLDLLTPSPVRGMFSPLTAFTPMEWTWLEERSPVSLEYRELAASLIEKAEEEPVTTPLSPTAFLQDSNPRPPVSSNNGWGSPVSSSYFLYSPRCGNLSPTFGLPSPGSFAGFDLETI